MTFSDYLHRKNYTSRTIASYLKIEGELRQYCKNKAYSVETMEYKHVVNYIKRLQRKGNSKRTQNHTIGKLRHYFDYLIAIGAREEHPCEELQIKGAKRKTMYNLLNEEELEDLYYSYQTENEPNERLKLIRKRNKIIVGLLVYQGIKTAELCKMKVEDVHIEKGKISIPSVARSNRRTLTLKAWQMIELLRYVEEVRPKIQSYRSEESELLFISPDFRNGNFHSNSISRIISEVRKQNTTVENAKQIRASVITNWLNHYSIRKVQIMAGHRYISSTEAYRQDDLESLQEAVNQFHPMR